MKKETENLHENHRERMRKRFLENGFRGFDDHQVLEFLLFYAVPRRDTNELAHRLINEYGGLSNLMNADPRDLMKRCKIGEGTAILAILTPHLARRYFQAQFKEKTTLDTSRAIGRFAISLLAARQNECFFCICLDTKRRVIASALIAEGSINQTEVYPRQIVECALKYQAAGLVMAHNHPSGDIMPSESDIKTTKIMKNTLDVLDIDLADHIIVGGERYYSFAEDRKL